jgi:hypothetical protein
MSPDQVAPGLIEEAVSTVKAELVKLKTRTRLAGTKVKDLMDDLEHLSAYLDELKTETPTQDLLNYILGLAPKFKGYLPAFRQAVSNLEALSDRLEELIP